MFAVVTFGRNVHQFDVLLTKEVHREVQVFDLLQLHFGALVALWLNLLARENLEQIKQIHTVLQILVELDDFHIALEQKSITPTCKRLLSFRLSRNVSR